MEPGTAGFPVECMQMHTRVLFLNILEKGSQTHLIIN